MKNLTLKIGIAIVCTVLMIATFANFLTPWDPTLIDLSQRLLPPNFHHFFGTDHNGSDILSRLIMGARLSLFVSVSVVTISCFVGLIYGSLSAVGGQTVDQLMMRFLDIIYAFPGFLLALAMVSLLGPSLINLIFAMCLTGWAGFARLVRGEVLHLKEREHVQAARALGATQLRVLVRHIWPNLISVLVIQATFAMAGTIITESSLSFLGLGVPPETPTWGSMLNSGRQYLLEAPYLSIFPGLAIILLVLGLNFLGDGLRDALDPKKI